ncbi:PaeR7I family type II restriction endonuclease [Nocardioides aestuarii]|uniref:PaeR7I family type II restriction endonuclease n=1 Tax=Nocardioides aestuarii TaxID=252231 RepID=A0ABW4TM73_9ACTN
MKVKWEDYDDAVRALWTGRQTAAERALLHGKADTGTRGTVTSGKHLDPLQALIAAQFEPLLALGAEIGHSMQLPLPGYYRKSRNWDVVVLLDGQLVAAVEAKSMSGSFGNNLNNRVEEAIGSAADIWRAYQDGLLGQVQPWIGWVYVLESRDGPGGSNHIVQEQVQPIFPSDPFFANLTYMQRARASAVRLVHENLYNAACIIASRKDDGIEDEPDPLISTHNLTASIAARVTYFETLYKARTRPPSR